MLCLPVMGNEKKLTNPDPSSPHLTYPELYKEPETVLNVRGMTRRPNLYVDHGLWPERAHPKAPCFITVQHPLHHLLALHHFWLQPLPINTSLISSPSSPLLSCQGPYQTLPGTSGRRTFRLIALFFLTDVSTYSNRHLKLDLLNGCVYFHPPPSLFCPSKWHHHALTQASQGVIQILFFVNTFTEV